VLLQLGRPALAVLARAPSMGLLLGFLGAVVGGLLLEAWRWRLLLGGVGSRLEPAALVAYRMAAHTIANVVPSARLGGEPLRVHLATGAGVPLADAVATVAIDRTVEAGAGAAAATVFATVLVQHGVPALANAAVTLAVVAVAFGVGVGVTFRRLRRGGGLVSTLATATRLDRVRAVADRLDAVRAAEAEAGRLVADGRRLAVALAVSVLATGLVLIEFRLLLGAFGLPVEPIAVVGAVFATGAARSLPVPAGIGVLEGAQTWLFAMLGHPPEVGLAVGLAVRLREVVWTLPGAVYLLGRQLAGWRRRVALGTPEA
jgi:uncharacterized protein (TIRG00374 family)